MCLNSQQKSLGVVWFSNYNNDFKDFFERSVAYSSFSLVIKFVTHRTNGLQIL